MDKNIIIPAHGIYCLEQIEYQACAAEGLIDNVVNPMFQCLSCKGLLEEYAKETGGDLDKAARNWMQENVNALYAAIRAVDMLLQDLLEEVDSIPKRRPDNG